MTDRETVISELELAASLAWDSDEGQCEIMDSDDALTVAHAIRDALELLKEQEPVKSIKQTETITRYKCGFCGNRLYLKEHKFCHWCGKAVKWDD